MSYLEKMEINSITNYLECLDLYSANIKDEISFNTNTPIFLDTNILLRYYSISFTAREKLYEFIEENKQRIVLTSQVQYEFLKNRENVIQSFFEQVTNRIPKDFNSEIVNKMKAFLDNHKIVLKDYPFVETEINKHKQKLEILLEKLNETSEEKRINYNDLIIKDKFLKLLESCIIYDDLTEEEIEKIKKDFDTLSNNFSKEGLDSAYNKPNFVFPGMGDIKLKPEDPYGDYIIFHEIMKYSKEKETNTVFLTFDNTKGDWMTKTKKPLLHYVQNMFANTGKILYVLDADRSLGERLKIDIDSLVQITSTSENENLINVESLKELLLNHPAFDASQYDEPDINIVKELNLAGYTKISEIIKDLEFAANAFKQYQSDKTTQFNSIGVLRISLRIANNRYEFHVDKYGNTKNILGLDNYADYRKFLGK
ncbi:PIN-like domain-containing protein [Salinimicrobium flavum]|uniref:PIN-like domain-containing protein n=1 Tax=Salinimicrobium flavum TaxID=1737065 RepID=A0ABW5J0F3_9FLAO